MLELSKSQNSLVGSFENLYLEKCTIDDQSLAEVMKLMPNSAKLKRIVLVDMQIGPRTIVAIFSLIKHRNKLRDAKSFAVDLRGCKMVGFDN